MIFKKASFTLVQHKLELYFYGTGIILLAGFAKMCMPTRYIAPIYSFNVIQFAHVDDK